LRVRLYYAGLTPTEDTNNLTGAEKAAEDGGMIVSNMDLSYLGVHCIWTNSLGESAVLLFPDVIELTQRRSRYYHSSIGRRINA
jgi:hypothetical protein